MPVDRVAVMTIASAADLLKVLREQGLLDKAQLTAVGQQLNSFVDARALARDVMQRDWLTPYQVNQIFLGKGASLSLGPYVVLQRLGEGGMGQVFKARHRLSGQIVALKLLRPDMAKNPELASRFKREIRVGQKLAHPNVVLCFDADHSGEHLWYAMEFVEGMDLAKRVQEQGPLSVNEACDYIAQAARGLQHAHEQGMVHRDIKPSNLLLSEKHRVIKLLDMGLARSLGADCGSFSSTLTQDGMVMGTPDYIAPEQALDSHGADIRADIYSLGCTFYFLLTGHPPFASGSTMQKLAYHLHAEPPPVEETRPDVPRDVARVLRKMMAKKREERYQTPAEVAAALRPFVKRVTRDFEDLPPTPIPPRTEGIPIPEETENSGWIWVVLGGSLVLVLAVAILLLLLV